MISDEYASRIPGVRLFRRKELEPVATVWEYQVGDDFTRESAKRVFAELPDSFEVCCLDLDESKDESYAFIRRVGRDLIFRRGGHGWMSDPEKQSIERMVEVLLSSLFVKKPDKKYESFSISKRK